MAEDGDHVLHDGRTLWRKQPVVKALREATVGRGETTLAHENEDSAAGAAARGKFLRFQSAGSDRIRGSRQKARLVGRGDVTDGGCSETEDERERDPKEKQRNAKRHDDVPERTKHQVMLGAAGAL